MGQKKLKSDENSGVVGTYYFEIVVDDEIFRFVLKEEATFEEVALCFEQMAKMLRNRIKTQRKSK